MAVPLPTTAQGGVRSGASIHSNQHTLDGTDPIAGVYYSGTRGTVTQATSITTGVTLHRARGTITTVSQTIGTGAEASFTVTNNYVDANDVVVVNLRSTSSAGGPFLVFVSAVSDGSFTITISNTSSAAAGNNTLTINFAVLKSDLL